MMKSLGIDIGGANLKLSDTHGMGREEGFPFWKSRDQFPDWLASLARELDPQMTVGVTMTAELADCFESRQQGVSWIVDAVDHYLQAHKPLFYQSDGTLVTAAIAKQHWQKTAASNWHASASWVAQNLDVQHGIFVDIGSTTADLIPILKGVPAIPGATDRDRLTDGTLVYAGSGRTAVFGLLDAVQVAEHSVRVAREQFCTTGDALLLLGHLEENGKDTSTADGRPRTRKHAAARLARLICCDANELSSHQLEDMAQQIRDQLVDVLAQGLNQVLTTFAELPQRFIAAGRGAFLVQPVIDRALARSSKQATINPTLEYYEGPNAQLLPAHAVAVARANAADSG